MNKEIKNKVLIIAADMGAYHFLLPIFKKFKKDKSFDTQFYVNQVIKKFIETKKNNFIFYDDKKLLELKKNINDYRFGIFTSNAKKKDEIRLMQYFIKNKILAYSLSDNWTNFKDRFKLGPKIIIPNKIFVIDRIAYQRAIKDGLNKKNIYITGSPYIDSIRIKSQFLKNKKLNILFISEPLVNYPKNNIYSNNYTELEIIKRIIFELKKQDLKNYNFYYKIHPNFKSINNRIMKELSKISYNTIQKNSFAESIKNKDIVIGMKSFALIEAGIKGKVCLSIQNIDQKNDNFIGNQLKISYPIYKLDNINYFLFKKKYSNNLSNLKRLKFENHNATNNIYNFIIRDIKC